MKALLNHLPHTCRRVCVVTGKSGRRNTCRLTLTCAQVSQIPTRRHAHHLCMHIISAVDTRETGIHVCVMREGNERGEGEQSYLHMIQSTFISAPLSLLDNFFRALGKACKQRGRLSDCKQRALRDPLSKNFMFMRMLIRRNQQQ